VLTYAMIRANDDGWATAGTFALLAISLVALVLFFVIEARSRSAMLDLGLLRNKAFVGILIASLLVNFAAFSSFTYTSIWLQSLLGLSPIESGMTGLPLSVAAFAVSAAIGRFLHHRNPGPIIGTGMILIGLGALANASLIGHGSSWPALILGFTITGVGVGLATPTLNSSAMSAVPVHRGGMAAGAVTTVRQLGFAIGIALLGTLFATKASGTVSQAGEPHAAGVAHNLAGGQAREVLAQAGAHRAALDSTLHAAAADGLDLIFLVSGIAGIVGGLVVLILVRPAATSTAAPEVAAATA
jgi:predicted MFS family arabinose efflux permease